MRKNPDPRLPFILMVIAVVLTCINAGVLCATFKPSQDIANYIPSDFTIDEAHSSTQNLGMYVSTAVIARKANDLPKPFTSPTTADFSLGYLTCTDQSILAMAWREARQHAEEHSKLSQSNRSFIGKEDLRGGGVVYWYKSVAIYAQGPGGKGYQLEIHGAEFIKQTANGILTVLVSDFVGEQDTIRKWFDR